MYRIARPLYFPVTVDTVSFYPGINTVKASLILLVIFAHSLPAGMIQYYNYFFEMPLFMAISGFLIKETTFKFGLRMYLRYLIGRIYIPWIIAFIIYFPLQLGTRSISQVSVNDFIYPFYHLWFIPAYTLGAISFYAIIRFKLQVVPLLIATGVINALWYVYIRDTALKDELTQLQFLGDKRFYAYLFFFLFGVCLRNKRIKLRFSPAPLFFILLSSFTIIALCIQTKVSDVLAVLPYLFFNFSLAAFVLLYVAPLKIFQNGFMTFVNKNSLGIYLFHPMIVMGIYYFRGDSGKAHTSMFQGFLVGVVTIMLIVTLVWALQKWHITNRYALGNVKPKAQ